MLVVSATFALAAKLVSAITAALHPHHTSGRALLRRRPRSFINNGPSAARAFAAECAKVALLCVPSSRARPPADRRGPLQPARSRAHNLNLHSAALGLRPIGVAHFGPRAPARTTLTSIPPC